MAVAMIYRNAPSIIDELEQKYKEEMIQALLQEIAIKEQELTDAKKRADKVLKLKEEQYRAFHVGYFNVTQKVDNIEKLKCKGLLHSHTCSLSWYYYYKELIFKLGLNMHILLCKVENLQYTEFQYPPSHETLAKNSIEEMKRQFKQTLDEEMKEDTQKTDERWFMLEILP
jgi:hypothetical protein